MTYIEFMKSVALRSPVELLLNLLIGCGVLYVVISATMAFIPDKHWANKRKAKSLEKFLTEQLQLLFKNCALSKDSMVYHTDFVHRALSGMYHECYTNPLWGGDSSDKVLAEEFRRLVFKLQYNPPEGKDYTVFRAEFVKTIELAHSRYVAKENSNRTNRWFSMVVYSYLYNYFNVNN